MGSKIDLLSSSFDQLSLKALLINLVVAFVLSLILKWHYEKFGTTFSGKFELSRSIPFLVLIVCFIISVVKSSLALSLGLVGALSIVRFRTPIKEPEELIYLFMAIAIGLGLGAGQITLSILATVLILLLVAIIKMSFLQKDSKNFYLSVTIHSNIDNLETVSSTISQHINVCDLRKVNANTRTNSYIFQVYVEKQEQIIELNKSLKEQFGELIEITFIDQTRSLGE